MKRTLAVLLCIALLTSLCACDDDTSSKRRGRSRSHESDSLTGESNADGTNWLHMPSDSSVQDNDMPSKSLIQADILEALSAENAYASITGAEVVKSLTNDNTYSMTLEITAETKYADWQYEADMFYTKYDQGWMVDEVNWLSKEYVLARTPDVDTIAALANEEDALSNIVPVGTGEINSDGTFENETLLFSWEARIQLKHAHYWAMYTTRWTYHAASDTWCFADYDDDSTYLADRYDFRDEVLDFSGTWHTEYAQLTITDFSYNGFTLDYPPIDELPSHFVEIMQPSFASDVLTNRWFFSDETGLYACMQYHEDATDFTIFGFGYGGGSSLTLLAYVPITAALPSLND